MKFSSAIERPLCVIWFGVLEFDDNKDDHHKLAAVAGFSTLLVTFNSYSNLIISVL